MGNLEMKCVTAIDTRQGGCSDSNIKASSGIIYISELQAAKISGQDAAESMRVVICDGCATIRYGLDCILNNAPGIDVVMHASSPVELLNNAADLDVDIIEVGIDDENQPWLEYLSKLRNKLPQAKILVFTDCD